MKSFVKHAPSLFVSLSIGYFGTIIITKSFSLIMGNGFIKENWEMKTLVLILTCIAFLKLYETASKINEKIYSIVNKKQNRKGGNL